MYKIIPSLLILSPYLFMGLRLEYLVIPALIVPFLLINEFRVNWKIIFLSSILLFPLLPMSIGALYGAETGLYASPITMLSRLVLPGLMPIFFSLLINVGKFKFIECINVIVFASMIVAVISILSFIFPDLNGFLSPWVKTDEESVWSQSIAVGRFIGIFNQPLEAGLFFTVSLFALIVQRWNMQSSKFGWITLFLIVASGLLTLSKVFLVLGLSLGFIFAFVLGLISPRALIISLIFFGVFPFILMGLAPGYMDSLLDLNSDFGLIFALTGGRLGASSENSDLYLRLIHDGNWIFGFGLGSQLPLDSGYLEYFYQGGILPFFGYILFILIILFMGLRSWTLIQGKILTFMGILLIIASIGGPVVSAGRANIIFIFLLSVAFSFKEIKFKREKEVIL